MYFVYLPFNKYKVCKYFSQTISCIFILLIFSYAGQYDKSSHEIYFSYILGNTEHNLWH